MLSKYNIILSKYKYSFEVQKYTFQVQKYTFKVQKYTFKGQKNDTFEAQKYTFKGQKNDTFEVQKYAFKVQYYTFESTSILSKYNSILFKYKSILSRFKSILSKDKKTILSKYNSILSKYRSALSKYKSILSKYKSILSKYKATFGTLGTESPESGTFLIPLVPGTRFPEPVPSKPREQHLTRRNPSNGSRNQLPEPVPGTRKSILCKDPIAFCCWGKNTIGNQNTFLLCKHCFTLKKLIFWTLCDWCSKGTSLKKAWWWSVWERASWKSSRTMPSGRSFKRFIWFASSLRLCSRSTYRRICIE